MVKPDKAVVLGLAPCGTAVNESTLAMIAEAIVCLNRRQPLRLKLFEFNGHKRHGDGKVVAALQSGLASIGAMEVIRYRPDPLGFLNEIATCDAFLAMRLHSAVFAFLREVPLVMLSYHTKCDGFAGSIGLPPRNWLNVEHLDASELVDAFLDVVGNATLPASRVEDAVASARRHFEPLLARQAA